MFPINPIRLLKFLNNGDSMENSALSNISTDIGMDGDKNEWKKMVEATLFKNPQPLSIIDLHTVFPQIPALLLPELIGEITQDYISYQSSIQLRRFPESKFGFVVRPDIMEEPSIIKFTKKPDLESGDVQILSFIAYNQPIELQDIIDFLDKKAKKSIQLLEKMGYISANRTEHDGISSCIYTTTQFFADYMGIPNDIEQIKTLIQQQYEAITNKPKRTKKPKKENEIVEESVISEPPREDKFAAEVSEEEYRNLVAKFSNYRKKCDLL